MTTDKHTILYAEDDFDDLYIVQQAFERHDHIRIVHAVDGREAISKLETMADQKILPCLVILDINMPVLNGREALYQIRQHPVLSPLPAVLFSTSNSPADAAFAETHDAVLITKPIEFRELEDIALLFIDRCNFEINKLLA